jgi:hypothetical protein
MEDLEYNYAMPVQSNESEVEGKNESGVPETELFSWTAPARPFKKRDREFYVTAIAIASIVGLVLFIAEGFMPVVLLISLMFLFYVMNTVEPDNVSYKITSKGVKFAETLNEWEFLQRFWFSRRFSNELLVFQTKGLAGRLELVINAQDKDKIRETLKKHLPEEEAPPSVLDKAANWVGGKLPNN